MVCVSKRPAQLDHIVDTWTQQTGCRVELILVTNAHGYAEPAAHRVAEEPDAVVIETDPAMSLGQALNLGVAASSGQVIVKVDDDDDYSPDYAADVVATMRRTAAGVVGKKTYFVYLAESDRLLKMHPGNEDRRVGRVAGGTVAFHRQVASQVQFEHRTLGEDVGFVRAAERAGFAVYGDHARGYLQTRHRALEHTWSITDDELMASCDVVGSGRADELWQ